MSFVKVKPLNVVDEVAEFYLGIDRISSFNTTTTEANGECTEVSTVYGTTFHVAGKAEEFAEEIRTAIYRMTYFPPPQTTIGGAGGAGFVR